MPGLTCGCGLRYLSDTMSLARVVPTWPGKEAAHTEWFPVCLALLLFCLMDWCSNYHTHTHTHTGTRAHAHECTCLQTLMYEYMPTYTWNILSCIIYKITKCTHIYIYIYADMHASPPPLTRAHKRNLSLSLSLSLSLTHTHTHIHAGSHAHTCMHTYTHMHACTPACTHVRMPAHTHAHAHIIIPDFCEMRAMHHRLLQLKQAELWLQNLDRRVQS